MFAAEIALMTHNKYHEEQQREQEPERVFLTFKELRNRFQGIVSNLIWFDLIPRNQFRQRM